MTTGELHRLRHGVYRVLGAGFAPPAADFLAVAPEAVNVLDELGLFDYAYAPHIADVLHEFADADPDELHRAYATLFETGGDGDVCMVRESAFRGDPRTGESARVLADAVAAQRNLGVEPPRENVDHASTELASMASACRRLADVVDDRTLTIARLRAQDDFLRTHLLRWLPALGRQLDERSPHPAFAKLGAATVAVLTHERQHLPLLLQELEEPVR
ncbi:MAG TPA: molecular chaperone TorD family protein [Ilumatobacter sp.]|nr:molecular chaperone TorD family protein [Ilumatobacter sp.]